MGSTENYYYDVFLPNEIRKRKEQMTNYDMDAMERRRDMENRMTTTTTKGKVIQPESQAALSIELPDDVIFNLSMLAHERGITLNKMIHIALEKGLSIVDNKLKTTSPQLLNENN
jgi:purine-nucleoside phosphorylase